MGPTESSTENTLEATLEVFAEADEVGAPLTASEVADELDCARRTAYGKLETLAERGRLETKKVGARGRVWWRPVAGAIRESTNAALEGAQFEELVDAVRDYAIFVLDGDGRIRTWNEGARRIKRYDAAEIRGEHFSTFYTEADREAGVPGRNLERAAEEGRVEDEGWRVRADGTTFWANVTITALRDDAGGVQGFVKVTRDMTERHAQEERLRQEKERFQTLVDEVKDYAIFMLDADGVVQTWNEGARRIKGYESDEVVGEHFSTFYTEEEREAGVPDRNLELALEDGRVEDEGWRVRSDGTRFWANVTITALRDDDGELGGFAKVTRDMTERHEYEERLREQRDELDELNRINAVIRDIDQALVSAADRQEIERTVCDRLAASDTYVGAWIGEYTGAQADLRVREWAGVDDADVEALAAGEDARTAERDAGASALRTGSVQVVQRLDDGLAACVGSAVTVPLAFNDVEYGVLTVYADHESAFDQRALAVLGELGETISHAIAAVRRKERERTLTALQESTRGLLRTNSRTEIGEILVETVTADLALEDAVVYWFDTAENTLDPGSSTVRTAEGQLSRLTAGTDSAVWTSFMEGEAQLLDADAEAVVPASGLASRQSLVVPLGDHGVLAVATADRETFDSKTRNLVELVAATGEAACDRVESQANLRERDELLQEQNQRLQRVNAINTIIREVDQALVQATTREEVQRVVCDRLAESERFRFAWIGAIDDVDGTVRPRAHGGIDRGYLDSVTLTETEGGEEREPTVAAAETEEVVVVSNVADALRSGPWRREAFSREFQSVISVPLVYGDVTYGVLSVYGDRPDVFEEMERSVFAELGETIANTLNAVETKQALLSDRVVELEFRLRDGSTTFLSRVAEEVGCEVTLEGVIPLSEGRARLFFVIHDVDPDDVEEVLDRSVAVESSRLVAAREGGHLFEAVVSGPTIPRSLADHGASLRTLDVTDDGVRVVVDLPASADVRSFIERFQTNYESAEFVARRERDHPVQTREGFRAELEDHLTERQLEVLQTAYYSGFFASPRRSTGGDVADVLGVTQPTVTEHLRSAQRTVLDLLFTENGADR